MFSLQKLINWTHSSVVSDKRELNIYQLFKDQFNSIQNKTEEYIKDCGYDDINLLVNYNGKAVSLMYLNSFKDSLLNDKTLSTEERAIKVAEMQKICHIKLKELEARIIPLAIANPNNIYLAHIKSSIDILNSMLKEYVSLLAIERCGVRAINGSDASKKLKTLKDAIDIRIVEIEGRLSLEENYRRY